jgi:hypothetical protein
MPLISWSTKASVSYCSRFKNTTRERWKIRDRTGTYSSRFSGLKPNGKMVFWRAISLDKITIDLLNITHTEQWEKN